MSKKTRQPAAPAVQLELPLSLPDYRVYVVAVRKLRRIMGPAAPTVLNLIGFSLSGLEPTGVASHYLEAQRWPVSDREVPTLHRAPRQRIPCGRRQVARSRAGFDPSRN